MVSENVTVVNLDTGNIMVLWDPNYTLNLACNGTTRKYSKEECFRFTD